MMNIRFKYVIVTILIIFEVSIITTFCFADYCIQILCKSLICRAVADNLSHSLIAALIWLLTCIFAKLLKTGSNHCLLEGRDILQVLGAFLSASLLDLDHFILARSLFLSAAVQLPFRPFGHTFFYSGCFLVVAFLFPLKYSIYLVMYFSSTFSHILRDSVRRGLWFWPIGSTPSLPLNLVFIIYLFQPVFNLIILDWIGNHQCTISLKKSNDDKSEVQQV